jgi:hypothetical protein
MKVNVEVDCTPEEARRVMGLPDLTPLHDKYLAMLSDAMEGRAAPEMLESLTRSWSPMGEASMKLWRQMFEMGGITKSDG